jgi:hypothetical protein
LARSVSFINSLKTLFWFACPLSLFLIPAGDHVARTTKGSTGLDYKGWRAQVTVDMRGRPYFYSTLGLDIPRNPAMDLNFSDLDVGVYDRVLSYGQDIGRGNRSMELAVDPQRA